VVRPDDLRVTRAHTPGAIADRVTRIQHSGSGVRYARDARRRRRPRSREVNRGEHGHRGEPRR